MSIDDYINIRELRERLDGDIDLLKELVEIFAEDVPNLLDNIEDAIKKDDAELLRKTTHKLKGSISNFSPKKSYDYIIELENIAKTKELSKAKIVLNQLKVEIDYLVNSLTELATKSKL